MEEQNEGSAEVLKVLNQITAVTQNVQDGAQSITESSATINIEMEKIRRITEELHSGMGEMTEGSNMISKAIHDVLDMTRSTTRSIEVVDEVVGHFKVQ